MLFPNRSRFVKERNNEVLPQKTIPQSFYVNVPRENRWKESAMKCEEIMKPKFVSDLIEDRRDFIMTEAKLYGIKY